MAKINLGRVVPEIANNLTTTMTGSALDAAQGPIILGKIDDIKASTIKLISAESTSILLVSGSAVNMNAIITAPYDCIVIATVTAQFFNNSAGKRTISISVNGTSAQSHNFVPISGDNSLITSTFILTLKKDQILQPRLYHNAGTNITLSSSASIKAIMISESE